MNDIRKGRGEATRSPTGMVLASGAGLRPYPGLRPFEDSENHIFFGRDQQVEQIIERMERYHVAAVMGGSGCGKSSIVRAGVVPRLHAYGISSAGDAWLFVIYTPQNQPITRLANALDKLLVPRADEKLRDERREQIRELLLDPDGLEYFLEDFSAELAVDEGLEELRSRARLLVIVDQFEEILRDDDHGNADLTASDKAALKNKPREAKALTEMILHCFRKEPEAQERGDSPRERVYIMITLRTEDLHKCAEHLELPEVLNRCSFMARRLNESELETAIESPPAMIARRADIPEAGERTPKPAFDTDLLTLIYDDLARNKSDPDHLPLLQHLLYRLWECAQRRENRDVPARVTLQDLNSALHPGVSPRADRAGTHPELSAQDRRSTYRNPLALCLERQADWIYAQLDDLEKEVARVMFQALALVDTAGNYTRRWTRRTAVRALASNVTGLGALNDEQAEKDVVAHVLRAFSAPNHPYLRGGAESETENIDVSHEAFIRKWPRFAKEWLVEDQKANAAYAKLLDSFNACSKRCGGKPTLWRRLHSLCAERLSKSARQVVAKHRLTERGEAWVGLHGHSEKEYGQVVDYYHASQNLAGAGWALSVLAVFGTFAALIVMVMLGNQSDLYKAEANVFQPFGVAARMNRPRESNSGQEQLESYRYALWEGAVALKALQDHLKTAKPSRLFPIAIENQLRIARAEHLALSTVNEASQALLSLPVWLLGGEPPDIPEDLKEVRYDDEDLIGADDDACLKDVIAKRLGSFGWPADARVNRTLVPGRGALPERRLYYYDTDNPVKPAWIVNASLAGGQDPSACQYVSDFGEGPQSRLGYVDPELRFIAVVREVEKKTATQDPEFRYRFVPIRWGLKECKDDEPCSLAWTAAPGSTNLNLFKREPDRRRFYAVPGDALIRLGEAGEEAEAWFFAAGTPPVSFVDPEMPAPMTPNGCDPKSDEFKRLSPKKIHSGEVLACAFLTLKHSEEQSLVAAARTSPQDKDEQIVEIWLRDEAVRGKEGESILDNPIARLSLKTPPIDQLRFLAGDHEEGTEKEQLRIGVTAKNGERAGLTWTWGGKAALEQSCSLLRQLPDAEIGNLRDATRDEHSAFFAQISSEKKGSITRNNNLDELCSGSMKETAEADHEAVARKRSAAIAQGNASGVISDSGAN